MNLKDDSELRSLRAVEDAIRGELYYDDYPISSTYKIVLGAVLVAGTLTVIAGIGYAIVETIMWVVL